MKGFVKEYLVSAQYFAPRDNERLMYLGEQLSQRHLHHHDRLIGIVGDAGSGKSSLIKGMFPGMELTNDDNVVDPRKIMQVRELLTDIKSQSSYHLDIRFIQGFVQMYEIADFINRVLEADRRIIVEHFNLIYPFLDRNADIIIGIGEEIIVTHPNIFGPEPMSIYNIVHKSLKYRKMAHTCEVLAALALQNEMGIPQDSYSFSDIRNGFVLRFKEKPAIDLEYLEQLINEKIAEGIPVSYYDRDNIQIGDSTIFNCDGPRFHVRNTSEIVNFSLYKELIYDVKNSTYCLVGLIGDNLDEIKNRNTRYFLNRCNNEKS